MDTPYVQIDEAIMMANIRKMAEQAHARGVRLRPHAKTHKSPELALRQLAAGAAGITVAKVAEAELMAAAGIDDLFIAYPLVVRSKLERVARLLRTGTRVILSVDSIMGARLMSQIAIESGCEFEVRMEVDTGLRRTGVSPDSATEQLATEIAALGGLRLSGIYTYRGAMAAGLPTHDLRTAGHEEGELMVGLAERLRSAGLPIAEVSVGSTPTGLYAAEVPGVTEIRPGTYIYHDRMQLTLGVCGIADIAAAVVVTVVSVREDGLAVVDGGSKTFATDVQPGGWLGMDGFGYVVEYPGAVLERMNEEHGVLRFPDRLGEGGVIVTRPPVNPGDRLRIIPNHICSTVNLHNSVWLKKADGLEELAVVARGALT